MIRLKFRYMRCRIVLLVRYLLNLPPKVQGSEYLLERVFFSGLVPPCAKNCRCPIEVVITFVSIRGDIDGFGRVRSISIVPLPHDFPCFAEKARVEALDAANHEERFRATKTVYQITKRILFYFASNLCYISILQRRKSSVLDNSVQSLSDQPRRDNFRFIFAARVINRESEKSHLSYAGERGCRPGDARGGWYFDVDRSCRDFGEGDLEG